MAPSHTWPPLKPLDWIRLSLRALFLVALPMAAGFYGWLDLWLIPVFAAWGLASLVYALAYAGGWRSPRGLWFLLAADITFALAAVELSGDLFSPVWSGLLLPVVDLALARGLQGGLVAAGLAFLTAAALHLVIEPNLWLLLAVGLHALSLTPGGLALLVLAGRARRLALWIGQQQAVEIADVQRQERQRARTVFRLAAELNATLNYERVLDMALDLSVRALASGDPEDDRLLSALLLFEDGQLYVASARRLAPPDWRAVLSGETGAIARALTTREPRLVRDPVRDPELRRLTALHNCTVALCIPLTAGFEAFGVLVYAHPSPHYFTPDRVELLHALGDQAMIALQNARLYRDLKVEKERMAEIQEEARKKLARDLHDGPTQSIAAIAMRVNFARRLMERDPKAAADELFKVEDMARRTTKEIRHMLFTLRPLILESQGLVPALQQLAEKMRDTHGQNVIVEAQPGVADELDMNKQGVVFFIAEEAVNNARKHAEAEHIWVRLRREDDIFVLEVEDDGVGFNVGAVDANYEQRGSLGMVNMRERAELVSGLLRIHSAEGEGTKITVYVPLTEESAERLHRPGFVA